MTKRKVFLALALLTMSSWLFAQDLDRPAGFSVVLGPRIGGGYIFQTSAAFTASLRDFYPTGDYFPAMTLFGITVEERILLGNTRSHFAFQEIVLVGGLEQGIAMPEGAILIGYRDYSGLEVGIGPILHPAGFGVVAAVGWTFSYKGVHVPVDIGFTIPNAERPALLSLTTGFNFEILRRE